MCYYMYTIISKEGESLQYVTFIIVFAIVLVIILGYTYLMKALKKEIYIGDLHFEWKNVKLSFSTKERKKNETNLLSQSRSENDVLS